MHTFATVTWMHLIIQVRVYVSTTNTIIMRHVEIISMFLLMALIYRMTYIFN